MLKKLSFSVILICLGAVLFASLPIASELTGVSIERLGNKMVIHLAIDGSAVPIYKVDEETKVVTVTLKGAGFTEGAVDDLLLTEHERLWLSSIECEEGVDGTIVRFQLGPNANPLDFVVSGSFDEVQAVIYTDGSTGPLSEEALLEASPSERIVEADLSDGIPPIVEEELVSAEIGAPAEAENTSDAGEVIEEVVIEEIPSENEAPYPVVSEPEEEIAFPPVISSADEVAGEETEASEDAAVSPVEDREGALPPFIVEAKLSAPPLILGNDRGGDGFMERLYGEEAGSVNDRERSFLYGSDGYSDGIYLAVDDAPLSSVLASLIGSTNYNVIVSDAVSDQQVRALTLDNLSLFEALDLLTRAYNLSYVVEHNTIVIGEKGVLEENFGKLVTKTFWLNYADGASIAKILVEMGLAGENNVKVYNGEIEFLTVNGSTSLESSARVGVESGDIKAMKSLISTARRNMLVVTETTERMTRIAKVIADLDKKPVQISLEVEIIEISETGMKKLGLDLIGVAGESKIDTDFIESIPPDSLVSTKVESFKLQTIVRDPLSFTLTLNHLIEDGEGKMLAKPNLNAIDGTQAIYFAGQEVPYITTPAQETAGTFTPAIVDFKTVGITLNFKPRVDDQGNITIEVNPQVSTLIGFIDLGQGATAPHTQTRQATATVRVKSGDIFILGGMITEEEKKTFKRIPLLSKIPFFGRLFESHSKDYTKSEVVVIMRPVIGD